MSADPVDFAKALARKHAPKTSDDALALQFAERHADELRYVAPWNAWLIWKNGIWARDEKMLVWDRARAVCREAAATAKARNARQLGAAKTTAAVLAHARADQRLAATAEQWDADPWLLNTPAGIVDLRTGVLAPHRRDAYMTKSAAVAPGGDCPRWLAFLRRILAGDGELIAFMQRAFGYALTGMTSEHALFFGYGTGGNGKGVLLNTITRILGGYASVAPMETFTAAFGERHPTDLAMLRGARLVVAQETEQGRQWAESRIKALTGGDPISARFMRADFFTYVPQFKLFIAGNHKPTLRGVDEAMRRRLNLIPFTVTIPPAERDPALPEKLEPEWPGILEWMVAGCLEWQRIGLAPPAAVTAATTDYLAEEDTFGGWLEESVQDAYQDAAETTADLFASWRRYAEAASEIVGAKKAFVHALQARGYQRAKLAHGVRGFRGIRLVRPTAEARHEG